MQPSEVRPIRPAVMAGLAVVAVGWTALLVADVHPTVTLYTGNLGTGFAALLAGAGCLRTARRRSGRPRVVWGLLSASATSWGLGQMLWSYYEIVSGREVPFPSLSDLGFLLAVPLAVAALLLVPSDSESAAGRGRTVLDGLLVAASLLLLSYMLVLGDLYAEEAGNGLATAIGLAYPVGDVVLATIVAYVALGRRRATAGATLPLGLVGTGIVFLCVADTGFAYFTTAGTYHTGNPIDAGWFLGYLLLFAASLYGTEPRPDVDAERTRTGLFTTLLPYVAVVTVFVTTSVDYALSGEVQPFVAWTFGGIILMLVLRQVLTVLENRRLTDDLRAQMAEVHGSERRFRALVQHSSDVVAVVDADAVVAYCSDSVERILGHPAAALVGRPLTRLLDASGAAQLVETLREDAARPRAVATVELAARDASGRERPLEITVTNLLEEPSVGGLVLNMRDVSEQRALEAELVHQAFHDSLTSLANRALFKDRVDHALSRDRGDGGLAVLFLDLDGFKVINDSLGHAAGDRLLTLVAERLRSCVRPSDTIARLGGDEFAILLEDARGHEDAVAVAERVEEALRAPFSLGDRPVEISGSIGIATAAEGQSACEELLRNADLAMYRAKAQRRGGHEVFDDGMHTALVEQLQLESDLARAVVEGELRLHYQPTYEIASSRMTGVEALLRWEHPERGLLGPGAFIPDAERSGLIVPIGAWVLEEACRQAVAWQAELGADRPLTMSVNVSSAQVTPDLPPLVEDVLRRTGMPPHQLVLEMTESMLIRANESADVLRALKDLGVRLAIDDFGTGYSSLSYLHEYPVDLLKIDRSFVGRIRDSAAALEMISAIVQLARSLHLGTVAEGIEEPAELAELRRIGCEMGQGFHLARPAPAEVIEELLGIGEPAPAWPPAAWRPRERADA
jgi:diguanylate cyclase (GGDEF)-like protein/PAS domain S-box-containing protein